MTGKFLPHDVQRSVTVRQPIRSSTFLPQTLQFIVRIAHRAKSMVNWA